MSELDYVGRRKCGCVVAWISCTVPQKDLSKEVSCWLRKGLSVERMSVDDVRTNLKLCKCVEREKGGAA